MDWMIERIDGLASSAKASAAQETRKILFASGGRCNPLKRLKTAKEMQGNPSLFL
jgi:hypothetical protein